MELENIEMIDENYLKGYEYETLMNALHVSVFKCLLNDEFTAIWCNNYFFESTGYTKEEYISAYNYSIRDYFSCMTDEYAQISAIVMDTFQRGLPGFECVSRMPHKNGSFIWIKVVGTFTSEMYEGIPVLYVVYTDITDVIEQQELSKRLEERSEMLRIALDEAERANHAKSDFLSRMSHDIRTPLNAIIGMTEIADSHLDNPEKVHDCHKKIALSSRHLLGLINDVLDMSKIESGKMTMTNSAVSLPDLVKDVAAMMLPDMNAKNQSFAVYPHNIRYENIYSDELRLRQIFLNILSNASKFTPEGGRITFEIIETDCQKEGTVLVQFLFSDTGIGMRPEFLEHIFDTFTREQDSRVDKTVGSGLGMAITKKIVDLLGGTIEVSSQIGLGTTFIITLPFLTAAMNSLPALSPTTAEAADFRALFIDSDPLVCDYTSEIFRISGLKGECISTAEKAVEKIQQAHSAGMDYDAVILDWKMNSLDNCKLIERIQNEKLEHTPVFIASAYDWNAVDAKAWDLGISGIIIKPFFYSTLCDGLNEFILNKTPLHQKAKKEKSFNFKGKRFLLAEDNELNREIAVELLSATGAEVDTAFNGRQCVEMFDHAPNGYYDLILMDIQMPVMNGYDAAAKIRSLPRNDSKSVQIWAMTADAFVEDIEKAKAVGMNGHFAKPLDILAINTELSRYFG